MLRALTIAAIAIGAPAAAQVTGYTDKTDAPANDPNKIVCEREEQIGSRLAGKKVCLSIRDWEARKEADRLQTEEVQAGARMRDSADPPDTPGSTPQ